MHINNKHQLQGQNVETATYHMAAVSIMADQCTVYSTSLNGLGWKLQLHWYVDVYSQRMIVLVPPLELNICICAPSKASYTLNLESHHFSLCSMKISF